MPRSLSCPDLTQLERLLLGGVAGPEAVTLEEHVADCSRCGAAIARLTAEDPLVEAMRARTALVGAEDRPLLQGLIGRLKDLRPSLGLWDTDATGSPTPPADGAVLSGERT